MKASSYISSIIITIFLTLATVYVYNTQTRVLSRGQATQIMSEYGTVHIQNGIMLYTHDSSNEGYNAQLLQSLALMSEEYLVYSVNGQ